LIKNLEINVVDITASSVASPFDTKHVFKNDNSHWNNTE